MSNTELKHTPGPWEATKAYYVSYTQFNISRVDVTQVDSFIGEVGDRHQPDKVIEANAKLIAAAPELLEALQLLLSQVPANLRNDWLYGECKKAEAAIAKATE